MFSILKLNILLIRLSFISDYHYTDELMPKGAENYDSDSEATSPTSPTSPTSIPSQGATGKV